MDYEVILKKGHIFELSRMLKKAGIKIPASEDPEILGDALTSLVHNIGTIEKEVDRFLAGICKIDLNEVKDMDAPDYVELAMYVFNHPNLRGVIGKFAGGKKTKSLAVENTVSRS